MGRGASWATVHGWGRKSRTRLSYQNQTALENKTVIDYICFSRIHIFTYSNDSLVMISVKQNKESYHLEEN